jgi:hypothetical protein
MVDICSAVEFGFAGSYYSAAGEQAYMEAAAAEHLDLKCPYSGTDSEYWGEPVHGSEAAI